MIDFFNYYSCAIDLKKIKLAKFFLKRIRIRQETDLKIPKAFSNRVFDNGYSKRFRDMTSGTKLKKMIKEHVWKKNFSQTYSNKAGNGFEKSKGA